MDKKTIIAIALSIAVLIGFQYFMKDNTPPQTPQKKEAAKADEKITAEKALPADSKSKKAEGAVKVVVAKTITVENDLYKAVLSSKGASVKSVELKKFKDAKGNPLVLNGDDALPALGLGSDEGLQFAGVNFDVSGGDVKLDGKKQSADIVFEYKSGDVRIKRTFTFSNGDYGIALKDEVKGPDSYFITLGRHFGVHDKENADHFGPILLKDTDRIALTGKDVKDATKSYKENVKWIATEDKYFASFVVPKGNVEEARAWSKDGDALIGLKMKSGDNSYLFYAGPKEYDILEKYNAGMEHVIDFGFFSILARPLFWFLKWINGMVHNFGYAIIILTIVTRIPFIPLINKGQKSMKKMSEMQPRMAEIKEKYKNDPKRMQQETMEMYKKHKINPVGGCLPMLLQIPFFFALFSILSTAIELRQAPFIFWITDLAGPDNLFGLMLGLPFVIGPLPLLMGATMFIQQKMTPAAGDPKQQKIMLLMPVIFTFMFLSFASGLVLFWLVNNILSIIQQFYINKQTAASQQQ
jgi:YidC/Oxa1 family membrane protein insertase